MTIRRQPEDFIVEETLRDDVVRALGGPSSNRRFAVYNFTKTSLTTEGAAARLARTLGVPRGQVSYAGLKDKHAHTTQHFTVGPIRPGEAPPEVAGENWSARLVGWSAEPAVAAWIRRNRFAITLRDLTPARCERMDSAADVIAMGPADASGARRLLFVNYFGAQRFGSARHARGFVAKLLVRGDFEGALRLAIGTPARKDTGARRALARQLATDWGRWDEVLARAPVCPERRAVEVLAKGGDFKDAFASLPYFFQLMCVESYQSHLWNAMARLIAIETGGDDPDNRLVADDPFGPMVFPAPARVGVPLRSLELPLPGPNTRSVDPWRRAAESVMDAEELRYESLVIAGLRRPAFGESWRPLFAIAERFRASPPRPDRFSSGGALERTLTFDLPRGAYATVLLRALGE